MFSNALEKIPPLPAPRQCFLNRFSLEQFISALGANWSYLSRALDWPNCSALAPS